MKKMAMFRICLESFFIMNENQKGVRPFYSAKASHTSYRYKNGMCTECMKGSYVSMRRHVIRGEEGQTECL